METSNLKRKRGNDENEPNESSQFEPNSKRRKTIDKVIRDRFSIQEIYKCHEVKWNCNILKQFPFVRPQREKTKSETIYIQFKDKSFYETTLPPNLQSLNVTNEFTMVNCGNFGKEKIFQIKWLPLQNQKTIGHHLMVSTIPNNIDPVFYAIYKPEISSPLQMYHVSKDLKTTLAMKINHDHGFIWSFDYYPNLNPMSKNLGYLACSFSDGFISLFVVPYCVNREIFYKEIKNQNIYRIQLQNKFQQQTVISALKFSYDMNYLVAGSFDGTIHLYKCNPQNATGARLSYLTILEGHFPYYTRMVNCGIRSISFSHVNNYIFVTCGNDGRIRMWDLRNLNSCFYDSAALKTSLYTTCVKYIPGCAKFLVCGHDGGLREMSLLSQKGIFSHVVRKNNKNSMDDAENFWNLDVNDDGKLVYCTHGGVLGCVKHVISSKLDKFSRTKYRKNDKRFFMKSFLLKRNRKKIVCISVPYEFELTDQNKNFFDEEEDEEDVGEIIDKFGIDAPTAANQVALYDCKFAVGGPFDKFRKRTMASGGTKGLLYIMKIPYDHIFEENFSVIDYN